MGTIVPNISAEVNFRPVLRVQKVAIARRFGKDIVKNSMGYGSEGFHQYKISQEIFSIQCEGVELGDNRLKVKESLIVKVVQESTPGTEKIKK